MESQKLAYSVSEAAELLGLSRPTIYQLIHRTGFPVVRIGRRTLIPRRALEDWIDSEWKETRPHG